MNFLILSFQKISERSGEIYLESTVTACFMKRQAVNNKANCSNGSQIFFLPLSLQKKFWDDNNNDMKLIIGLGNPGKEYEKTRHNAGFLALDKIAGNFQFPISNFNSKFNAEISQGIINNEKIILAKPMTFMNNSGQAVQAISDYYKIDLENIIVIHDDLDIPLGEFKISKNKNSGGHKGVQSIIDCLGTKDFTRIRIGIDSERNKKIPTEKFVLEKFDGEEMGEIEKVMNEIVKLLNC